MNWYLLAIISFLAFGYQNYLYKVVSLRKLPTRVVTFVYVFCSAVISWGMIALNEKSQVLSFSTFLLAGLDAVFYYATTISRIEALHYIPTYLVFPIARLSTFFIVLYGTIFFGEEFSFRLGISVLLLLICVYLINSDKKQDKLDHPDYSTGILLALLAMVTSMGTNVVSKYAAIDDNYLVYTATANSLIAIITLADLKRRKTKLRLKEIKEVFPISFFIAVINLIGWFAYLYALKSGPLSIVAIISSLAFIVPIVLSVFLRHEKITWKKSLVVGLSALIMVVLKS
jgi:drug/metabolite transporter (DMT)-like permease